MKTWLREHNSINIQGRIIVLVHCHSSHCHLSINQVSFQTRLYFPRYGPAGIMYEKKNGEREMTN